MGFILLQPMLAASSGRAFNTSNPEHPKLNSVIAMKPSSLLLEG